MMPLRNYNIVLQLYSDTNTTKQWFHIELTLIILQIFFFIPFLAFGGQAFFVYPALILEKHINKLKKNEVKVNDD